MGMLVLRSGWMPGLLGWTLVVGGVGYVVSAFAGLVPGLSTVSMVATLPATIGEFWMIGYLLVRGTRTERALPPGGGGCCSCNMRSEERRVGKECDSRDRSGWTSDY